MNPDNTIEYNSLSWVKAQLDDVLSDAQLNLNEYIENKTDENLENCIEHLQLIFGTLQMVEVYGAAMLAEEMQQTTVALLEGHIDRADEAYDVLMRAMLQLPDYLESIQAGKKDTPITLAPLINDLRAVRKEGLLTESALFSPDIEKAQLASDGYDADTIETGKLEGEVKRLRTHYQLGLLDYIRNKKERVGLQRIKAVLNSLEKVSSNAEVRRMWMVIGVLVEGLIKRGIDANVSINMLLGAVDRQLKLILDVGEEEFSRRYSKKLVKNALYYVGLCTVESKSISAVKEAYNLSDLIHKETEKSATAVGGLNADLFNTVSKGITEDLVQVKDVLELFMLSNEQDMDQLVHVADQLGKIADTYGMLGMGATRQSIMEQRVVLESIVNGDTEISEPVVSGIAFELLNAESELKDYIASRSGFIDSNRNTDDQAVPAAEYRDVVFTVVSETLKNFSEAKEAILSYVSGIGDKEQLDIILNRLEEVRGVSMMLPLDRVGSLIEKLQNYIRIALVNNNHQADENEQNTVADVVTSIEYFFEALSEGRPGVEQGLNTGDEAACKLDDITQSYRDLVQDESVDELERSELEETKAEVMEVVSDDVMFETASISQATDNEDVITEQVKQEAEVSETVVAPQDVEQYAILAEDADEEIVEIFIEEAVEVLGELHNYLPQWKDNYDDEEALAVIRRSFHTLKGSGRLLGADLIGEFSWKFENMLNRVIDKKINVSDALFYALDEAVAVLPQLIEQLKGNREPIYNISQLMLSVDALAEGREVSFDDIDTNAVTEIPEAAIEETESISIVDEIETGIPHDEIEGGVEIVSSEDISSRELSTGEASDLDVTALESDSGDSIDEIEINADDSPENDDLHEDLLTTDDSSKTDVTALESDSDASIDEIEINADDSPENDDLHEDLLTTDDSSKPDVTALESDSGASIDEIEINADDSPENDDLHEDLLTTDDSSKPDVTALEFDSDASIDEIEINADDSHENDLLDEGVLQDDASDDVISSDAEKIVKDEFDAGFSGDEIINLESDNDTLATGDEEVVIEGNIIDEHDSEQLIYHSDDSDISNEYEVVIDNEADVVDVPEDELGIDSTLLRIYHDESQGHVETVRQLINKSEFSGKDLKAGKSLMRAFHTLYGSARTAQVEPIADLSGAAEKYIKARQESTEKYIPYDVVVVLKEIEQAISAMLLKVADNKLPASDKILLEKINKIVQQEIQDQLQKSWQEDVSTEEDVSIVTNDKIDLNVRNEDISIDIADLSPAPADDDLSQHDTVWNEAEETDTEQAEITPASEVQEVIEEPVQVSYGDIDDELINIFLEEAEELLENSEGTLSEIKNTPNSTEHIHQLQRNMHTLKGGARMADLSPVGDLTHNLESLVVMVDEKKVDVDKALFDLLQESLDTLTTMLANVKQRQSLAPAGDLNKRIEMLMRGEIEEKRTVERFDVELSELEESADEEDLESIDISDLLPKRTDSIDESNAALELVEQVVTEQQEKERLQRRNEDKPHWGERASDVNFKDSQEQVRVRSDLLNNLVNYAGEVNIYHARMGKQITDFSFNLSELTQTVVRLKEQLRNLDIETEIQIRSGYEKEAGNYDDSFDPLEMDQYSTLQQLTRSLRETAGDVESINEILTEITRDSETLLVQESRVSTDLQEGLMRTRMVRFGGLSSRLRRIVRQISRELGKEVELEIIGESSEVDRTVLDRIIAPLEHMLRNAVAHGIESPEVRKALGKKETGRISIKVDRQGTDIVINVKDDGAGIDVDKIREKVVKKGLVKADAALSDHDILQFILQSGFTTADEITQVAGRGVGMDVVDSEIKQLGGVLGLSTRQGESTEFNVRLPLTLAINQALLVSAADDVFAVPLTSIEGVVRITGLELQRFYDSDHSHYEFNGVEYELKHLGGLLTGNQPDYSKQLQLFPVLLVQVGEKHFALHVEDMIGRREIVVKPVGMQIGSVHGIAGATILADGRVVLILEMSSLVVADSLFKSHESIEVVEHVVEAKKTVMVVDDSITIRKITERMLKRYGIEVILAKDGVDATNQLQDCMPDLMLLDIEMPRMDGFEVASYVRNDDRLKNIPIIMITSRTGSKHKEKAMEIGVNQYLGKPYQEEELVNNINEILHTSF